MHVSFAPVLTQLTPVYTPSRFAQFAVFVPAAGSCCRLVTRISTSVDAAVWSVIPQPDDNISSVEEEQRSLFYFLCHCQVLVDCL